MFYGRGTERGFCRDHDLAYSRPRCHSRAAGREWGLARDSRPGIPLPTQRLPLTWRQLGRRRSIYLLGETGHSFWLYYLGVLPSSILFPCAGSGGATDLGRELQIGSSQLGSSRARFRSRARALPTHGTGVRQVGSSTKAPFRPSVSSQPHQRQRRIRGGHLLAIPYSYY